MLPTIEVIIPTLCDAKRGPLLQRAIESVVSQDGVTAVPIVVVNGSRFDPAWVDRLKQRSDIRFIQIPEPSLFAARRRAFESLRADFFATLDDDDIFLPGALKRRLEPLQADPSCDWVVTNGAFVTPDGERSYIPDIDATRRDPFGTLLDHCWLCSAGNLFRRSAMTADFFDATRSMDITYMAFRLLAEGKKVVFLDDSTFRYFYYPDSTSKQDFYNLPAAEAIRRMMDLPVPAWVRRGLAGKYRRAMHDVASYHCCRGEMGPAWQAHRRSLAGVPEFFRFLSFTRLLIAGSIRSMTRTGRAASPDRPLHASAGTQPLSGPDAR
jgi:glycosyltransferase involved in cell wall biosynthesis